MPTDTNIVLGWTHISTYRTLRQRAIRGGGVHKTTVYRLENEVTGAGPITVRKLCRVLGVEPGTLRRTPAKSPY